MQNRAVNPEYPEREVFQTLWYKDNTAFGQDILFIFQPQLYFPVQFAGIFRVTTDEGQDFVKIMGVIFVPVTHGMRVPPEGEIKGALDDAIIQVDDAFIIPVGPEVHFLK